MKINTSKIISKIHIYGGLYCAAFIFLMGISGFYYNHPALHSEPKEIKKEIYQLGKEYSGSMEEIAIEAEADLGLYGYSPYWQQSFDEDSLFHFRVVRPTKIYMIVLNIKNGEAEMITLRKSFMQCLGDMHVAVTGHPDHWTLKIFRIYSESAVITAFFVLLLSLYFWFKRSFRNRSYKWMALLSSVFVIIMFLLSWLRG